MKDKPLSAERMLYVPDPPSEGASFSSLPAYELARELVSISKCSPWLYRDSIPEYCTFLHLKVVKEGRLTSTHLDSRAETKNEMDLFLCVQSSKGRRPEEAYRPQSLYTFINRE